MKKANPARSPNVLFVFADQMSANHLGCGGNPDIITPVLDQMAADGVMLSTHVSNCPICSPNRATMLTGTYPHTHGVIHNDYQVRTDLPSLATVAAANGCKTGYIGKWHIQKGDRDAPILPGNRLGFNDLWAAYNCHHEYFNPRYYLGDSTDLIREDGYEPEIQTRLALDFLDLRADDGEPFLLAVSYGPPHNAYELVPGKYQSLYDADKLTLRPNCRDIPSECLDPAWEHRRSTRDFYALVSSLDDMMGRLLAKLDEIDQTDNTIVVFTSDHGDMLWSQGLLYKCVPFDESIRIPLVIRYPKGLQPGRRIDDPVSSVDLLPTLAGLAGWDIPETVEGGDYSGLLRGESGADAPEAAFSALHRPYVFRKDFPVPPWTAVRTARYTYVEKPGCAPWMLFDNHDDPYQMQNRVDDPQLAPQREHLKALLEDKHSQASVPYPTGEATSD